MNQRPRTPDGKFAKGQPRPNTHRPKGSPNRFTRNIKEALTTAGELVGRDGAGKDGLTGLFVQVGQKDPAVLASLITRAMPLQIRDESANTGGITTVNILPVASGQFVTRNAMTKLARGVPLAEDDLVPGPEAAPLLLTLDQEPEPDADRPPNLVSFRKPAE
jgi:hypothetical protein